MRMTIGKRTSLGFIASVLITIGLAAFTYKKLQIIETSSTSVATDSFPGITDILTISVFEKQNTMDLILQIQANSPSEIAQAEQELKDCNQKLDAACDAYETTIVEESDRQLFDTVKRAHTEYNAAKEKVLTLSRQNKDAEALAMFESEAKPAIAKFDNAVQAEVDDNGKSGKESIAALSSAVSSARKGADHRPNHSRARGLGTCGHHHPLRQSCPKPDGL